VEKVNLRVKVISYLKDIVGKSEITIEVKDVVRVRDLIEILRSKWPRISEIEDQILIVLKNGVPAKLDDVVTDKDDIAILPPVSGG